MNNLIENLAESIEFGKINFASSYPPKLKGLPGADEICKEALEAGLSPQEILNVALIPAMSRVGQKFSEGKAYVPEMLMAAKAMAAAMVHLKPFFSSGEIELKGVFIIGTVFGDLHDIGKNLVAMMVEGAGWKVIDLGVDVKPQKFIDAIDQHKDCVVALSALLTTTMMNMESIVKEIRKKYPSKQILVGGAPLNQDFCIQIGANHYSSNPQGVIEYLNKIVEKN
ncbi:MAG: cobalamin-dependent protein [Bacteroidales bacterium]|nr:cobalamin-dependent protein [Bacteroidales bacterium]